MIDEHPIKGVIGECVGGRLADVSPLTVSMRPLLS